MDHLHYVFIHVTFKVNKRYLKLARRYSHKALVNIITTFIFREAYFPMEKYPKKACHWNFKVWDAQTLEIMFVLPIMELDKRPVPKSELISNVSTVVAGMSYFNDVFWFSIFLEVSCLVTKKCETRCKIPWVKWKAVLLLILWNAFLVQVLWVPLIMFPLYRKRKKLRRRLVL